MTTTTTTTSTTRLFVGGPAHGELREHEGNPSLVYVYVLEQATVGAAARGHDDRLPATMGERTHVYVRWRPPVVGPLPADVDPAEHRLNVRLGDRLALERERERQHPDVLLHEDLRTQDPQQQLCVYADALYRAARS